MHTIVLQHFFEEKIVEGLMHEFPQCIFRVYPNIQYKKLSALDWEKVEVFLGSRLIQEELDIAKNLNWIHSLTPDMSAFCLQEIQEKGSITMTRGKEENLSQIAEFALSAILCFSKNLFNWKSLQSSPSTIWDSHFRENMWQLKGSTFLQVGLSEIGTAIAKTMQREQMVVKGVSLKRSFHPYCTSVHAISELKSLMSTSSFVSVESTGQTPHFLEEIKQALKEIKKGAILLWMGDYRPPSDFLAEIAEQRELRGVILDASYTQPVSSSSKIWLLENCLVTPYIARRPQIENFNFLKDFRFNLRQYLHGSYKDMRNVVISAD